MSHKLIFALLFAVITCGKIASAQISHFGICPALIPIVFDWSTFKGIWFEYARIETVAEASLDCVYQNYRPIDQNKSRVTFSYEDVSNRPDSFEATANIIGRGRFSLTSTVEDLNQNYKILGSDNNLWAVIYSCKEVRDMRKERAWILTRERSPRKETVDKVLKVFDQSGVSQKDLRITRQSSCRN